MLAQRFPFAVYYDIHEDQVWVVAVLEMRKKPAGIITRLRSAVNRSSVSESAADYNTTKLPVAKKSRATRKASSKK